MFEAALDNLMTIIVKEDSFLVLLEQQAILKLFLHLQNIKKQNITKITQKKYKLRMN